MEAPTVTDRPCLVCGGKREAVPVMNDLTGKQLRRGLLREPVWRVVCSDCGRQERSKVG